MLGTPGVVGFVGVCSPGGEAVGTWVAQKTVRVDKTLKGKRAARQETRVQN